MSACIAHSSVPVLYIPCMGDVMVIVSDDWDVGEHQYFNDDVKFIAELLQDNWDTFSESSQEKPVISYDPNQWQTSARSGGFIYVYQISRYNSVATMDYRTLQRTVFLALRLTAPHRDMLYRLVDEVYKIIMAFRRTGQAKLFGYTYMEIINDRIDNGMTGWYTDTMDLKLTCYNYPIDSDGFGIPDECEASQRGCDSDIL